MIPLRLGPLDVAGFTVLRSGIRWLRKDGDVCRPGEIVAFCNVGLLPSAKNRNDPRPFGEEWQDVQIGFAPRIGGELRVVASSSLGGFVDEFVCLRWDPDFAIGHIVGEGEPSDDKLNLLMLAGRRVTAFADISSGLFTGWHQRSRAWRGDADDAFGTLLSLGLCEQTGIIRGSGEAFLELFDAVPGSAHAVFVLDGPLVPSAPVLTEQLVRSKAEFEAIAADFTKSFAGGPVLTPEDWHFAGTFLSSLGRSPLTDRYDVLTRTGLRQIGPADAVLLSLAAEQPFVMQHRRLGYTLALHQFRVNQAGPAVRAWLKADFRPVKRSLDDIRRDYRNLFGAAAAQSPTKYLILNCISTVGAENVVNYAPFDHPLGDTLLSVRNKELNLMLHDLAKECDIAIVDCDAIAAGLGTGANLLDRVHHSGLLQAEVRGEILRILRCCGVPGFERARAR